MKRLLPLLLLPFLFTSCELLGLLDGVELPNGTGPLTQSEAGEGLKEALIMGISKGVGIVGKTDGYFKNPQIKIPWPSDAIKVANKLRDIGLGNQVDKVELTINRGAEEAAKEAKPIFVDAIKKMTFQDAIQILKGNDNAATDYLKRTTSSKLRDKFKPVVQKNLDKVGATKHWGDAVNTYNKIPMVQKVNPDLNGYVTQKAMDGLFLMIGKEEKKIRENPVARTTDLLKRVFGYYENNNG